MSAEGGSTNNISIIGRIGMNTTLSACTGGLTSFFIHAAVNWKSNDRYSITAICNGILGGLGIVNYNNF